ncbi:cysteine-rich venom protein-like isoform X2 [Gouania willdenowi]|uniref:cysteine-rich venom protein-like isoform X2 n=1 Tax=Gouania willdenowi TaxID=441366 RepID=UPI0010556AD7|nr:cysteine-rich venom protein-like isoform X2 [Gouania willdenowi]
MIVLRQVEQVNGAVTPMRRALQFPSGIDSVTLFLDATGKQHSHPLIATQTGLFAVLQVPGTWAKDSEGSLDGPLELNDETSSAEQTEIVNKHNTLRRGVSPSASNMLKMSWNREASANAQRWANKCIIKHSPPSKRKISTSGCGENIYMSSKKDTWSEAIQSWYDEEKNWRYGVGSVNGGEVGHFTQLVWYKSNQIGCAMAHCPNAGYKYFYVCHYCPPGNTQFYHPYKSGPPCGDCPNACDNKLCTNPCPYIDKFSNCPKLTKQWGCSNKSVASWCPASCKCTSQII